MDDKSDSRPDGDSDSGKSPSDHDKNDKDHDGDVLDQDVPDPDAHLSDEERKKIICVLTITIRADANTAYVGQATLVEA